MSNGTGRKVNVGDARELLKYLDRLDRRVRSTHELVKQLVQNEGESRAQLDALIEREEQDRAVINQLVQYVNAASPAPGAAPPSRAPEPEAPVVVTPAPAKRPAMNEALLRAMIARDPSLQAKLAQLPACPAHQGAFALGCRDCVNGAKSSLMQGAIGGLQ